MKMTKYSVEPREQIFVKGYGFLSFAKNMDKNTGKKNKYKLKWPIWPETS